MDEKETLEALQDALQDFLNHLNEIASKDIEGDPQAERDRLGETLRAFYYLCDYLADIGHKVTPDIMGMLHEQILLMKMLDRGETPKALKRTKTGQRPIDTGRGHLRSVVHAAVKSLVEYGECESVPDAAEYIARRVDGLTAKQVGALYKRIGSDESPADLKLTIKLNDAAEIDNLISYLIRIAKRYKDKLK